MKKPHKDCCERYRKKDTFCKDCPTVAGLGKKKRRKLLAKLKR